MNWKYYYELVPEDKTRRQAIPKTDRLGVSGDPIYRLIDRSLAILRQGIIYLKERMHMSRSLEDLKKKYGEDALRKWGAKGGKTPTKKPKGFAANPELARIAGRKGLEARRSKVE